ncbi:MAG: hypothetical protein KA247_07515 [Bacteroidetes bacterium]|nr:hypothetical protein [Bacteroidota bacterium]
MIAVVPALMSATTRNAGFYLGVFIIMSVAIILRTLASAVLLHVFFGRAAASEKRMTFQWMMSISLYCQNILLIGKIAAVGISLLQYSTGMVDRFSVIRFIDLARIGERFGWPVPESIGRADIFSVLFIAVLARVIRSESGVSRTAAAAVAVANWLLIGAVQRLVIELPKMVWS